MLLAVTPLPNPLSTPPLTITYFNSINGLLGRRAYHINVGEEMNQKSSTTLPHSPDAES
jgi:hypothetical protein